jgi:hypothetical protein
MIQIEKNVPMPKRITGLTGLKGRYPLHCMEPGDSIFVECDGDTRRILNARAMGNQYGKRFGKCFSCHIENTGIRIWRTDGMEPDA